MVIVLMAPSCALMEMLVTPVMKQLETSQNNVKQDYVSVDIAHLSKQRLSRQLSGKKDCNCFPPLSQKIGGFIFRQKMFLGK